MNDNNIFVEVYNSKLREELDDLASNFIEDGRNYACSRRAIQVGTGLKLVKFHTGLVSTLAYLTTSAH